MFYKFFKYNFQMPKQQYEPYQNLQIIRLEVIAQK